MTNFEAICFYVGYGVLGLTALCLAIFIISAFCLGCREMFRHETPPRPAEPPTAFTSNEEIARYLHDQRYQ